MLAQTFVAALDKLAEANERSVAQTMRRMLTRQCGLAPSPNAQAPEATLVVHGEGDMVTFAPDDQSCMDMRWGLVRDHLVSSEQDPAAASSSAAAVVDLDGQGS